MEHPPSLVSSAFTSFSNYHGWIPERCCRLVSSAFTSFSNSIVPSLVGTLIWYLLLLHHSQTPHRVHLQDLSFGTFCFYIILKRQVQMDPCMNRLVPSAFTSFSNCCLVYGDIHRVWFLLLLHHSQTSGTIYENEKRFGSFCFYIILKPASPVAVVCLRLVPFAFTSFSNGQLNAPRAFEVWFLLLLHHSQTQLDIIQLELTFGSFRFYIILKRIERMVP